MASIGYSEHIPRGEWVVAVSSGETEVTYLMQATPDLAYVWFGSGILTSLRLAGESGWVLINKDDWDTNYWGLPKKEEE